MIKITDCLYILAVCYFYNMRIFWKVKIIKKWNEKYIYAAYVENTSFLNDFNI